MKSFDGRQQKTSYIGSDGTVQTYVDEFVLSEDEYNQAIELETQILHTKEAIDRDFLVLAFLLDQFDQTKSYLARGFTSFKTWADSPEVAISYRVAHDLVRIVRELLPALGDQDHMPSISQLRELLPILSDEDGPEKVREVYDRIRDMDIRASREEIKELRGLQQPIDQAQPALFMARVRRGETFHQVDVSCGTGVDYYQVGRLNIRRDHWPRWEERFGRYVEIIE